MRITSTTALDTLWNTPRGFIALEGVNGAGKSTLQKKIGEYLTQQGHTVVLTREPGATPLGTMLRSLLLESKETRPDPRTEIYLFAADRAEHVQRILLPALAQHHIVITDRYLYSSIAFQGYGRALGPELVAEINAHATEGLLPDLTILLDLDPQAGLERTLARNVERKEHDAFEQEEIAFHARLRTGFLTLAETRTEPFLVLDATQSPEMLFEQTCRVLSPLLHALTRCSAKTGVSR